MRKSKAEKQSEAPQCSAGQKGRESETGNGPPTCICSDKGKWYCRTRGKGKINKNGLELLFLSAGKESDYRFDCGGCVCACYGGAGGGGSDYGGDHAGNGAGKI